MGRITQAVAYIKKPKTQITETWSKGHMTHLSSDNEELQKLKKKYQADKLMGRIR